MATKLGRGKAAQAWCKIETEKIELNPKLAEAFAEIIDEISSKSYLGNATTGELLDELRARCEFDGTINYRTVDSD